MTEVSFLGELTFKLSSKLCTIHCPFIHYALGFVYELSKGIKFLFFLLYGNYISSWVKLCYKHTWAVSESSLSYQAMTLQAMFVHKGTSQNWF